MELLTVQETAALLRVAPVTVRRYIAAGRLAAVRVGRGVRVRREAVEGLLTPEESGRGGREVLALTEQSSAPRHSLLRIATLAVDGDHDGVRSDVASDKYAFLTEIPMPRPE